MRIEWKCSYCRLFCSLKMIINLDEGANFYVRVRVNWQDLILMNLLDLILTLILVLQAFKYLGILTLSVTEGFEFSFVLS